MRPHPLLGFCFIALFHVAAGSARQKEHYGSTEGSDDKENSSPDLGNVYAHPVREYTTNTARENLRAYENRNAKN
jgi:hypothetical protein